MRTYKFMKKNYGIFLIGLLLSVTACSFTTKKLDPGDKDKEEALTELVTFVLENYHYSPKDLDKDFSKKVYKEYLKNLDPRKRFFLQEDIDDFAVYEETLHDELKNKKVDFFTLTYDRLQKRMGEMEEVYKEILEEPMDFSQKEDINTDYDNVSAPKTKEERKEVWRKQLKLNALSSYYDLKKDEEDKRKAIEKGELEEDDEDNKPKTDEELEKEARKTTKRSLEQFYDVTEDMKEDDWFAMYLDAVAKEFDPHSGYFAPEDKDRFDIAMSGSLEGIGAQLQKDLENIKITELISGGPAWTDGRLEVGDVIKKVQQDDEDKAVNISGMSINDAVKLIRGEKGSKVILTVKKVDGTTEEIDLIRDKVELEETYAKTAITNDGELNYGLIKLPGFYFDMDDYDQRNAAGDMKKEIQKLKEQGMEGLVVDLRDNGGGSLSTAIDIAGLFVEKGPVVQVRDKDNKDQVLKHKKPSVDWDGPLVILVNELSASASEILAAAMQDYERAIIIGSNQTYGKGTVQNFLDLNKFVRGNKWGDMGNVKITSQKFYRINGGSTQLEGVHSDVVAPDQYSHIDVGERDLSSPLPYDQISKAKYAKWNGYKNLKEAIKASQKRVDASEQFQLIDDHAKWIRTQRDENDFSLNYDAYTADMKESKEKAKSFDTINKYKTDLRFNSLPDEEKLFDKDTTLAKKRQRWHKNLNKDIYVEEAMQVLKDLELSDDKLKKMAKTKN